MHASQDPDVVTLFAAVESGDVATVERALEARPELTRARDRHGCSLLVRVLQTGDTRVAGLVERAMQVLDSYDLAALGRIDELTQVLDRAPSMVTQRGPDGNTLLHLASLFGHVDVVRQLLRRGAAVDAIALNHGLARPLHAAAASGNADVVRLLLETGADPNGPDRDGWTPLHRAAARGDVAVVRTLLEGGADPHASGSGGLRPADLARRAGHAHLEALLQ